MPTNWTQYSQVDYRALQSSQVISAVAEMPDMRFDGADDASVFFARELDYIKAKTYDRKYPELTALEHFPVSSEVNPGAETVTYYSYEKTGFAKIITNYATDLPRADVKGKPTTSMIKSIGDAYGYSVQEMRSSRMAGKSLDIRKAEAARYASDRLINKIAYAGDSENNLLGILSSDTNIPEFTLPTVTKDLLGNTITASSAWKNKEPDAILADLNGMVNYQLFLTKGVENPDTLLLPYQVYGDIATRRLPNSGETVLSFLLKNSPWLKNVHPCPELQSDAGEVNPTNVNVAILYKKDPEKFTLEIPLMFYQYPLQPKGLEIEVPCEARVAGLIIYYPLSILIAKGV
jgi:hypothetical protein